MSKEDTIVLSAREMQVLMLCLRDEYVGVEGEADELHDKLAAEGWSAFSNQLAAGIYPKEES